VCCMTSFVMCLVGWLYQQLKTTQLDGLILYSGLGHGGDFLAVELAAGHLRFVFDVGSGPRSVYHVLPHVISDNQWHEVGVTCCHTWSLVANDTKYRCHVLPHVISDNQSHEVGVTCYPRWSVITNGMRYTCHVLPCMITDNQWHEV